MNKNESRYFFTARLMDEALLLLLEKKDIEFITVKEICEKAGVNRSTFYLHYDSIDDLFEEVIDMMNQEFRNSFDVKDIRGIIKDGTKDDLMFIKKEFIIPYLEFVKRNKRTLKMIRNKALLFKNENIYKKMCEELFYPILSRFGVSEEKQPFILEFFTRGTAGIIYKWLEKDCEMEISKIVEMIISCVNYSK